MSLPLALGRAERRRLALAGALGTATVAAGVALAATSAWLLATAASRPSIAALAVAIVGVRFFGLLRGLARYAERLAVHDLSLRIVARLRTTLFSLLEPLAPGRSAVWRDGELLRRLIGDVEALEARWSRVGVPAAVASLSTLLLALLLVPPAPRLALVPLGLYALAALAPVALRRLARGSGDELARRRGELQATFVESLQGSAELRVLGRAGDCVGHIGGLAGAVERAERTQARWRIAGELVAALAAQGAVIAVLAVSLPLVRDGALTPVEVAALALGTLAAFEAVLALAGALERGEAARAGLVRLRELAAAGEAALPREAPDRPLPVGSALTAEGVGFAYEAGRPVLQGVDFELPQGGLLVLTGASGAGKSTLLSLLCGFRRPDAGRLRLGGVDLAALDGDALRSRLSVVTQEAQLFAGSLGENLRLARPSASDAELAAALGRAGLAPLLETLPDGLATWIGEHGTRLSGGERQRLAVARALLQDRPIWLLDEPTAHLDEATARLVTSELLDVARGRTTILATHQPELVERPHRRLHLVASTG